MKIKIFQNKDPNKLQKETNDWFKKNNKKIIRVGLFSNEVFDTVMILFENQGKATP